MFRLLCMATPGKRRVYYPTLHKQRYAVACTFAWRHHLVLLALHFLETKIFWKLQRCKIL